MESAPVKHMILAGLLIGAIGLSEAGCADVPDPDPARFAGEIQAFVAWDRKNAVPAKPILFVGSSSIRLWPTPEHFPGKPVVNRGFGGSEISDVIHYYDQLIGPYAPVQIFLYAGDNDVATGKPAEQVFEDYRALAEQVSRDFPQTELVFISIKPSKARWALWPVMKEANAMIRAFSEGRPNLSFVDISSVLLRADGLPGDFYVDDGLHLNEAGYRRWQAVVAPILCGAR